MSRQFNTRVPDDHPAVLVAGKMLRLARRFPNANLMRAARLLIEEPERFLRNSRPRFVQCIGRRADGRLCIEWFWSPDVLTQRRCAGCHQAEQQQRAEMRRWQASREYIEQMIEALEEPPATPPAARAPAAAPTDRLAPTLFTPVR